MRLVTESVEPEVALRRSWKKFGLAANDGAGPNISSTILGEPVYLKLGMETDFDKQEVSAAQSTESKSKSLKCKYCNGAHFSHKCPYKDTFAQEAASKAKLNEAATPAVASEPSTAPSKYVPKFKRSGADNASSNNGLQSPSGTDSTLDDRDQGLAIRMTNLSEVVVENDIRELIGAIGVPIARCNVGRDRLTGRCKGYAFVNFYTKEDAETVMRRLNGFPYGNMILKVEIARPIDK